MTWTDLKRKSWHVAGQGQQNFSRVLHDLNGPRAKNADTLQAKGEKNSSWVLNDLNGSRAENVDPLQAKGHSKMSRLLHDLTRSRAQQCWHVAGQGPRKFAQIVKWLERISSAKCWHVADQGGKVCVGVSLEQCLFSCEGKLNLAKVNYFRREHLFCSCCGYVLHRYVALTVIIRQSCGDQTT